MPAHLIDPKQCARAIYDVMRAVAIGSHDASEGRILLRRIRRAAQAEIERWPPELPARETWSAILEELGAMADEDSLRQEMLRADIEHYDDV